MTTKAILNSAGDGTAVPSGYVGEVLYATNVLSNQSNGAYISGTSITLTPGVWSVNMTIKVGGVAPTNFEYGISTTINSAPAVASLTGFTTSRECNDAGNTGASLFAELNNAMFKESTTKQIWPTVKANAPTGTTYTFTYYIWATRIA